MDPARLDDAGHREVGQELAAVIRQMPGCQSFLGGVDRARAQVIAVSTWDTEDHARWTPDALGDLPSRAEELGIRAESLEIFEVIVT